jgi:O-antigen ligase
VSRAFRWLTVAVLVLSTSAFFDVAREQQVDRESNPVVLGLWALAYVVAGLMLSDDRMRLRRGVRIPRELTLFLALTLASTLWSEAPLLTLRRSIGLTGTAMVAILIVRRLGAARLFDALRHAMVIVAVTSLVLLLFSSSLALDPVHGTLRGVVATKNSLGFFMCLGLLASAAGALLDRTRTRRYVLSAAPMLVALAMTDSKTGIIIALAVGTLAVAISLVRRRAGSMVVGATFLVVLGLAPVLASQVTLEGAAAAIGEDTTLTGRDAVWTESTAAYRERPWFGYGYGIFWQETERADEIQRKLWWDVPTAHNGGLDVLLDVGVVGLVLALAVIARLVAQGLSDLRARREAGALLRLPLAALLVISNLVETNFLQQNTLLTLLTIAALALDDGSTRRSRSIRF